MFILLQFLAVPFGIVITRVFHCRNSIANINGLQVPEKDQVIVMDAQNEFKCQEPVQLTLTVLVSVILASLFLFYPFILRSWTKEQVFTNDRQRHEGYIQLKEAEYEQGLDKHWDIGQYHLFSSFQHPWVYYNSWKFVFKLLLLLCYAFSVRSNSTQATFWSSAIITTLFGLATLALIIRRPFRVRCFNFMIIVSHLSLTANALIGNLMVRPPWEVPEKFQTVDFLLGKGRSPNYH